VTSSFCFDTIYSPGALHAAFSSRVIHDALNSNAWCMRVKSATKLFGQAVKTGSYEFSAWNTILTPQRLRQRHLNRLTTPCASLVFISHFSTPASSKSGGTRPPFGVSRAPVTQVRNRLKDGPPTSSANVGCAWVSNTHVNGSSNV